MSANAGTVRTMLRTYGRQLTSAKRLARFRQAVELARGPQDAGPSREARRRQLVERIAREIIENLIVNGTENPVVREIRDELRSQTGMALVFEYPLDGDNLRILRESDQGPQILPPADADGVMGRLWEITLNKVDQTML